MELETLVDELKSCIQDINILIAVVLSVACSLLVTL